MTIDLTDEVLPYTPSDVDKPFVMAPGAALASPFSGGFPPAHEGVGLINTAGEYRGAYPSGTNQYAWRPEWSQYKSFRNKNVISHWGLDLYAPAGTPLLAIVDGELDFAEEAKLGTYARLKFTVTGKQYVVHYGHLQRAEGAPRSALKGSVVGYVGCSGNADQRSSCSTNVPGKTFSCSHVHLALLPPASPQAPKRSNIVEAFGWKVTTPKKPAGVDWL
jgi:murein DD-endopeptidase MepM/ murein hydrolase activator NlpD